VAAHIVRQVESVQAIDANEQNVLDLMFAIGTLRLQSLSNGDKEQEQRQVARKSLHGLDLLGDRQRFDYLLRGLTIHDGTLKRAQIDDAACSSTRTVFAGFARTGHRKTQPDDSSEGNRTVTYDQAGKQWVVTFVNNHATTIKAP
jgi:hypothetical protein